MTTYNNVLDVFSYAAHTLANTLWSERAFNKEMNSRNDPSFSKAASRPKDLCENPDISEGPGQTGFIWLCDS